MGDVLPKAPRKFERSNEQQFRRTAETRFGDVEDALQGLRTSFGTLSLGQTALTLINGANHNVAPAYTTFVHVSGPTAAFSITGFTSGEPGRLLLLANPMAFTMTIEHQEVLSTAKNRIITASAADVAIPANGTAVLVYDGTVERWRLT